MAAAQAAKNHGDERGLTRYFATRFIYPRNMNRSSKSSKVKDDLPWNISHMITRTALVTVIVVS